MSRRVFLTLVSFVAVAVGSIAILAPHFLLVEVKRAVPNEAAEVMARTVSVLLVGVGALNFLVRDHGETASLRAVLIAELVIQIGLVPIDPLAYLQGVFATPAAFLPNTILHLLLAAGCVHFLRGSRRGQRYGERVI